MSLKRNTSINFIKKNKFNYYNFKNCLPRRGFIIFVFFISQLGFGQKESSGKVEIESDPFAFMFNGYSLHAAYVKSNFRFSFGIFGLEQPKFALDNKDFSVYSSGFDVKTDYIFSGNKGLFIGVQATYGKDKFNLEEPGFEKNVWGTTAGLRTGYRFMFGKKINNYKGFYIVPWMMLSYSFNAQTIELNENEFEQAKWIPFPTVHLGWRF